MQRIRNPFWVSYKGEKARLQECVLHLYFTRTSLYFTVLHPYFTRTSLHFTCISVVLRCTSLVLHSYFTILHSYFTCTSLYFSRTSKNFEVDEVSLFPPWFRTNKVSYQTIFTIEKKGFADEVSYKTVFLQSRKGFRKHGFVKYDPTLCSDVPLNSVP